MTITEIKNLLDTGDYVKIARHAGYSDLRAGSQYVYMILSGRRNATKGKAKKILNIAEATAINNQLFTQNLQLNEQE
jgi:hypothetical protein